MPTMVEIWMKQGMEVEREKTQKKIEQVKRKAEQRIEQERQKTIQEKANTVVRFLMFRFEKLPRGLKTRIMAVKDVELLEQLIETAMKCDSMGGFVQQFYELTE